MKRTFGKFLSLMLVLAMLLAMVPAVLAASATDTNAYLAPGFDETFTYSYTGTGTAPDMSQLFWVSGNEKVVFCSYKNGSSGGYTYFSQSTYWGNELRQRRVLHWERISCIDP